MSKHIFMVRFSAHAHACSRAHPNTCPHACVYTHAEPKSNNFFAALVRNGRTAETADPASSAAADAPSAMPETGKTAADGERAEDWRVLPDPSGQTDDSYYWNVRTGATTWDRPAVLDAVPTTAPPPSATVEGLVAMADGSSATVESDSAALVWPRRAGRRGRRAWREWRGEGTPAKETLAPRRRGSGGLGRRGRGRIGRRGRRAAARRAPPGSTGRSRTAGRPPARTGKAMPRPR